MAYSGVLRVLRSIFLILVLRGPEYFFNPERAPYIAKDTCEYSEYSEYIYIHTYQIFLFFPSIT
jgi:hypothetical protein